MRGDRGFTLDETFPPFREVSDWCLRGRAHGSSPGQWELPGLGEWTVLELAAHASRAYLTLVETYLAPNGRIDIDVGRRLLPAGHARCIGQRRHRRAGPSRGRVELGEDPVGQIEARARRAVAVVELAPVGARCASPARGTLSLADYLATRVVELHDPHARPAAAVGLRSTPTPPEPAATMSLIVLAALAAQPSSARAAAGAHRSGAPPVGLQRLPLIGGR